VAGEDRSKLAGNLVYFFNYLGMLGVILNHWTKGGFLLFWICFKNNKLKA
jgi:hypothetical protein